jgi:hypothetical protein
MDYNFNNFQQLFYENKILKKQIKQLEDFVLDTRSKNIELIRENSKLIKIRKVKFTLLLFKFLKNSYRITKDEFNK